MIESIDSTAIPPALPALLMSSYADPAMRPLLNAIQNVCVSTLYVDGKPDGRVLVEIYLRFDATPDIDTDPLLVDCELRQLAQTLVRRVSYGLPETLIHVIKPNSKIGNVLATSLTIGNPFDHHQTQVSTDEF